MDVRLPDGTVIRNVPDGITKAELTSKLARNGYDVSKLGGDVASQIPGGAPARTAAPDAEPSWMDKLQGGIETARTLVTGATSGTVGRIGGTLGAVAGQLARGEFGTDKGVRWAKEATDAAAARLTYEPKSAEGQRQTEAVGNAIAATGVEGLPIGPEMATMGNSMRAGSPMRNMASTSAEAMAAQDAQAVAGAGKLADLVRRQKPAMAGGGAAESSLETLRAQRAAALPVPIDLTKGQRSRTFEQQRFEREAAKDPVNGERLRQRFAEQNEKILQNFDAWVDETGAAQADARGVGKVVTQAVVDKANRAKNEIRNAYQYAREAGEMSERVSIAPLLSYLAENEPAGINAPIISAVGSKIKAIDPQGTGLASLNDLEELRKFAGVLGQKDATNSHFGGQIRTLIDETTRDVGGPEYQQARRMYENYAKEFKNKAAVARLIGTKRGTTDQKVAYEDVFNKTVLNGSLDDVRAIRRTLQTDAGGEGQQAWKELQGQTIAHIKDVATSNSARDINGMPIVSAAKLDRLVRQLDADGKLDFMFGKQGAERIRDINDLAKDVYTAPPGSVNTSSTASVVLAALDTMVSGSVGLPLPLLSAGRYGVKHLKERKTSKRIDDALAPFQPGQE